MDRQLPNLAQAVGNRIGHRLTLQDGVDLEAEREDSLLDPIGDVPATPQVVANGTFVETDHPVAGRLRQVVPESRLVGRG